MEQEPKLKVERSPTRCPYCHDECTAADPNVACHDCLARHHTACWQEGASCGSCGSTRFMEPATPPPRPPTEPARAALGQPPDGRPTREEAALARYEDAAQRAQRDEEAGVGHYGAPGVDGFFTPAAAEAHPLARSPRAVAHPRAAVLTIGASALVGVLAVALGPELGPIVAILIAFPLVTTALCLRAFARWRDRRRK